MSGWDLNLANFIVESIAALATVGAVIVALALGLGWFQKPKLEIEFRQAEPYCRKWPATSDKWGGNIWRYWIRIRVTNTGKGVAKKCKGKLVDIKKIKDDGNLEEIQPFDPVILRWIDYPENEFGPIDLNRGEPGYLNVIYTYEPGESEIQKERAKRAWICGDTEGKGIMDHLPVGNYILTLVIYGKNVHPRPKQYKLIWKGEWDKIEMVETRS